MSCSFLPVVCKGKLLSIKNKVPFGSHSMGSEEGAEWQEQKKLK